MAAQNQGGPNMEQFEAYFRRADLDQDGRISGAEAVGFFQGSNLPKQVLAQIWMHADRSHTGYLSRAEFYDALKLVTVAQSKRELTPDIVKAALYGPASAKIPAPQINLALSAAPQSSQVGAAPAPQMGAILPTGSQNLGIRGSVSSTKVNQINLPSQGNQSMRPPVSLAAITASSGQQGIAGANFPRGGNMVGPGIPNSNISNNWLSGTTSGAYTGVPTPVHNRGISPSMPPVAARPQDPLTISSLTAAKDPKAMASSGNGFTSDVMFGGDVFSATQPLSKQAPSAPSFAASTSPVSSAIVPATTLPQSSSKPDPFEALQSTYTRPSGGNQQQETPSIPRTSQQTSAQITSSVAASGMSVGVPNVASEQPQVSWPKMTRAGVQKYTKVFLEVDSDRDGKITGEQARNLFLSWRLPREVLKQVWDLSDQDNDSMLSLREFCIALYLMERYREGRPLPSTLPSSIMLDETLLSVAGPPSASYSSPGWGTMSGLRPQQGLSSGIPTTTAGIRPPMQAAVSQADGILQFNQQNARGLTLENSHTSHLSNGEQTTVDKMGEEAAETEQKVESKEKLLLDSREKIEFYRSTMQDLVLYKSRCDNRLNEITERALADKSEAESLARKYEEKYKQVAEIASKLTIEEASFRDTQERKLELQQAIMKMEQGGSADGILQVRADRIQLDLEELLKALTERCKKHGIHIKSTTLIELPNGWQPGIPEVTAVWDEDWDKFEDEGFSFDVAVPVNAKSTSPQKESSSPTHSLSPNFLSHDEVNSERPFGSANAIETESAYSHSEDESRSPQGTPTRRTMFDSPSKSFSENNFEKSFDAASETRRSFDEPAWGTFDNNSDIDSVWGFNAKDSDNERHFFGSNDLASSPGRTESPQADSTFQKSSPFTFEDSVPGTPVSRAGNSPARYGVGSGDPFFDSFSKYDSFSTHDGSSPPKRETFARFDSINSTRSFDHSRGFSFDDSDPFGSSGPFKVSSEGQSSRKGSDNWNAF